MSELFFSKLPGFKTINRGPVTLMAAGLYGYSYGVEPLIRFGK